MSIYENETKTKIFTRSIEHQQESIKGNSPSLGATEHTNECYGRLDWLYPQKLLDQT